MVCWEESSKSIGYKVNKLDGILRSEFQDTLHKAGWKITPEQWGTIHFIMHNPGCPQTLLAKSSSRNQTSITRLLDGLQRKDFIERRNDESDRRVYRIYLTDKAVKMYNLTFSSVEGFNTKLKSLLSDEEGQMFMNLMEKLYTSIQAEK